MPRATSTVAVSEPAPATLRGIRLRLPAVAGAPFRSRGLRHGLGRVLWIFGGLGEVLIVAYAFPLAILAIGIPVALFVRLVMETGRALWHL
jgi:hypothetical protein